jgi:predicted HicB family RNase H-like nuclease
MNARRERNTKIGRLSACYPRVIEWSEEDHCYVGSAPPLVGQCCHGATEAKVAAQLAIIVADLVQDVIDGKMPEPEGQEGKSYSGKFVVRIPPAVHKKLALNAMARRESLNQFVAEAMAHAWCCLPTGRSWFAAHE